MTTKLHTEAFLTIQATSLVSKLVSEEISEIQIIESFCQVDR